MKATHCKSVLKQIDDMADSMMADCILKQGAVVMAKKGTLAEHLFPLLLKEIANWTGSSDSAKVRMHAMYNLCMDEFEKIA